MTDFALCRLPIRVAFLDDDQVMLDGARMALPRRYRGSYHLYPDELTATLRHSLALRERERKMIEAIAQAQGPVGGSPLAAAAEYLAWEDRKQIIDVVFADYSMPSQNGLDFFAEHRARSNDGFERVLFTGNASAGVDVAIEAFNAGLISGYIRKHDLDIRPAVLSAVDAAGARDQLRRFAALWQPVEPAWGAHLRGAHADLLRLLVAHQMEDWIILAYPAGVLGHNQAGDLIWIQLEDAESAVELAGDMDSSSWAESDRQAVVARRAAVNLRAAEHFGLTPRLRESVLLGSGVLAATVFPMRELVRVLES